VGSQWQKVAYLLGFFLPRRTIGLASAASRGEFCNQEHKMKIKFYDDTGPRQPITKLMYNTFSTIDHVTGGQPGTA